MKRGWGLLLLFAILLCLLASCIDPEKNSAAPETESHTETEEETTDLPDPAQPTLPGDPGWTKPY